MQPLTRNRRFGRCAPIARTVWIIGARRCADLRQPGHHHAVDMYAVNPQRSVVSAAAQIGSSATQAASNSSLMMISYG